MRANDPPRDWPPSDGLGVDHDPDVVVGMLLHLDEALLDDVPQGDRLGDEPVEPHATIAHVLFSPRADGSERVVTFDFEVAWGPRHSVKRLVSLELAQNLDSLARRASPWHLEALIAAIVRAYPDRSRLERLPKDVRRGHPREGGPTARLPAALIRSRR